MFRRLTALMVTLLVASLLIFLLLEILPGDPAAVILGVGAQEDTLRALRAELGLDLPAPVRYLNWLGEVLQGDLGRSYTYDTPVQELLLNRVELSLPLALLAILLSTGIAIPLGVFAASRHRKVADTGIMGFAQLGVAVPNFWFAILLILLFSVKLGWFSAGGFAGWDAGWFPAFKSLVLPAVALALPQAAILACDKILGTGDGSGRLHPYCKSQGPQQEQGSLETRGTQRLDPGGYHSRSPTFLPARRNDHHRKRLLPSRCGAITVPGHRSA